MAKTKSLKERLEERRKNLAERGGGGYKTFIFRPGITRLRHVYVGGEVEPAMEVLYVYLNKALGGFISPATWGEKCAFKKAFDELSSSSKESEVAFSKKIQPKKKFVSPAYRYKDEKGKEIDVEAGVKLALLNGSQYEQMLDLWLDDDKGDFTDPKNGYDLKHKRTGEGQFGTKYNVIDCNKSPAAKQFRGPYNIEEMARALTPTYKETKELLEKFMNMDDGDTSSNSRPSNNGGKKKKKKNRDL